MPHYCQANKNDWCFTKWIDKRFTKMEAIVHNFQKLSFTTASIIFNDCFVTMNYYLFFINTPQQPQCYLILDISFILMLISNAVVVFLNLYFQFLSLVSHLPFFIKFPACPKKKSVPIFIVSSPPAY